jgi:HSP20 family protein
MEALSAGCGCACRGAAVQGAAVERLTLLSGRLQGRKSYGISTLESDDAVEAVPGPLEPLHGMESWRSEMEWLFDAFSGTMAPSGANEALWYPRVDLQEHDQEFVLVADLPGMQQDDINITVENNLLTLQGTRMVEHRVENEQNGYAHYSERAFGTFCRRFTLGAAVDAEQITATYKAGVLEVHIPKTAAAQPKRIAVQSAA